MAAAGGHTILAPNTNWRPRCSMPSNACIKTRERGVATPRPRFRRLAARAAYRGNSRMPDRARAQRCRERLWRAVIESSAAGRSPRSGGAAAPHGGRGAPCMSMDSLQAVAPRGVFRGVAGVSRLERQFVEQCGSWIASTPRTARACDGADEPVAWIESPVWRPVARQWLQRRGMMIAPPASARDFASVHAVSPAAELAAIAGWALQNLRSTERFRAWICVRI